jgi:ribosomal-protein-alanine N-acetyltransferase
VIVGNPASARVLEKVGFRYEGTMRSAVFRRERFHDLMMFALLRSEWGG